MKHRVIGIDLGTTYSAVAAFDSYTEQAEVLLNRLDGNEATTPSVVSYHSASGRVLVGRTAKQNLANEPQNTVIEIKREMGELFRPETLEKFDARGSFGEGDPVKARFAGSWLLPQEISAFILMRLKEAAEAEIGEEVRDAVITVPAYFTANQRKATEDAALLAGLYPRQLIPEPTAAAICYGVDRLDPARRVYMVYDLGGGTFDVSIIDVQEEKINVIATSGDPRLGGGDFDDAITRWAVDELRREHQIDLGNDPIARARIKYQAEMVKIRLSSFDKAELSLQEPRPVVLTLTREKFESLIAEDLNKSFTFVEKALKAAEEKGVRREDLDGVLLVGGSTQIPKVRSLLREYFGKGKDFVRDDLDPAAVVARGAAILGYRFAPSPPPFDVQRQDQSTLVNLDAHEQVQVSLITEHSLGIGVQQQIFHKIIDQGTNIPIAKTEGGFTNAGPTDFVEVRVFQGEGAYVYDNTLIGSLQLGPMEPQGANYHQFEVTFSLDVNGLLSVMVKHLNTGKVYQARFEHRTSVDGPEALAALRAKLLRLYPPGPAASPVEIYVPPPPVPAAAPQESLEAPAAQPAPPPEPAAAAPANGNGAGTAGVVQPVREIPESLRFVVRRSQKQLLRAADSRLLEALNALVSAINESQPEEELFDLAETVDEAYQDARQRAAS
ncbi:MAG TPA: Hsp70 family protein [Thermoanaerobaculia bacterium]